MASLPYYTQKFETLDYPKNMSDVVHSAQSLIEQGTAHEFSDTINATRASWRRDGFWKEAYEPGDYKPGECEQMVINLADRGLIIALRHRHQPPKDEGILGKFHQSVIVIGRGVAVVHTADTEAIRALDNAYYGETMRNDFLFQMNHAMGALGIRSVQPSFQEALAVGVY